MKRDLTTAKKTSWKHLESFALPSEEQLEGDRFGTLLGIALVVLVAVIVLV